MSRDGDGRELNPVSDHLTSLVAGRLAGLGYRVGPDFTVMRCPACGSERDVRFCHEILNGEWQISCACCGHRSARSYYDAIRAVLAWNSSEPRSRTRLRRGASQATTE